MAIDRGEIETVVAGERSMSEAGESRGRRGYPARQLAIPALQRTMGRNEAQFAHPAEQEFAQLLSFYRVDWAYEPTAFALEWTAEGKPCRFFTPDFYLPAEAQYVELTTMRQPLVTRKNQKVRQLQSLYPKVRIKLLYKKDVLRLQSAYEGQAAGRPEQLGDVLFGDREITARILTLVDRVGDEWRDLVLDGERLVLLGVGRGCRRTLDAVAAPFRRRRLAVETVPLEMTRYQGQPARTRIRLRDQPAARLARRRVLVLADVVSSGLSLRAIAGWLEAVGVAEWRAMTLLDRTEARVIDVPVAWSAFAVPDAVVVGFGLALRDQFSNLPHIASLAPRSEG